MLAVQYPGYAASIHFPSQNEFLVIGKALSDESVACLLMAGKRYKTRQVISPAL